MENILMQELQSVDVKQWGEEIKGDISTAATFIVEGNMKVFVKQNAKSGSRTMFNGEFYSLEKISETGCVRTPKPIRIFEHDDTVFFVSEFLEMEPLQKHAAELGERVARMYLHNKNRRQVSQKRENFIGNRTDYVEMFGFDVPTSCGFNPMNNDWRDNWVEFFAQNRLKLQLDLIESVYGDADVRNLWPRVERKLTKCFPDEVEIVPSLLHGDFWNGNAADLENEPCIFDPSSFYGDSEYDLAFSHMFGGFPKPFYEAYHDVIPKQPGYEDRQKLYQLFNYLNHWNHFGAHYKDQSVALMREIAGW